MTDEQQSPPANAQQRNRAADPQFAAFVDACRRIFPGAELTYVKWPDGREWRKP